MNVLGKGHLEEKNLNLDHDRDIRSKEDFRWLEKLMRSKSNSGLIDT